MRNEQKNTGPLPYKLTNDYLFHAMLQKNETALRYLLSCLLGIPVTEIISTTLLNPIKLGDAIDEKNCILDLHINLNGNRLLNLEMQVLNCNDWPERSLYYLARSYCTLKPGQSYMDVLPTIHIGILNFSLFPEEPFFYSEYLMQNTKNQQIYSDKFSIRVLDLTQIETHEARDEYPELQYWAKFFVAKTWEEVEQLSEKSEGIREAVLTLKELTADEKIKLQCEARERYDHDRASCIRCGQIEGERKGEEKKQQEIARNMLHDNLPIEQIMKYTGLSENDIRALK